MVKVQVSTDELVAGRYRLLEVVHQETGRDGWYGQDVESERPVTLTRSLLPDHLREEAELRTAVRITRESEALGLVCPGRVAIVIDVVEDNDFLWTVTARPEGVPLSTLLGHGPVNHVRVARIGLGILDVLGAAHQEGITHGDLSPGQVWVQELGGVTVGGFGLMGATSSARVTTPSYASPEQARGEGGGPATDLWALGAIMYEMVEGRPAIRDRGGLEATLRAVERLPIRTPLNAGPLSPAIQGLLRRDPVERVPESVVREALTRILTAGLEDSTPTETLPVFRDTGVEAPCARQARGSRPVSRPVLLGGALAVTVVCFAGLTAAGGLFDRSTSASGAAPSPTAPGSPSAAPTPTNPTAPGTPPRQTPSASASPSRSATPGDPAAGFYRYDAPEGFSIDLPQGWKPLRTDESPDRSYRVTLGASDDPRTLAITYSTQLGSDPVAVWSDVDTSLRGDSIGYQRVGAIRPVTYRSREGADMEWFSVSDGVRERTFGRGFLIGDGKGFSLRYTTPAEDWDTADNRRTLDVFLQSFKGTSR
ncbi:serine/threonine protein kinase [Streptomyces sp. SD15]